MHVSIHVHLFLSFIYLSIHLLGPYILYPCVSLSIYHASTYMRLLWPYTYLSHACMYISFYLSYIYLLTWALYTLSMYISFYLSCTYSANIPIYLMHVSIHLYLFYLSYIHLLIRPIYPCIYVSIPSSIQPLSDNWSKPHDNSLCGLPQSVYYFSKKIQLTLEFITIHISQTSYILCCVPTYGHHSNTAL